VTDETTPKETAPVADEQALAPAPAPDFTPALDSAPEPDFFPEMAIFEDDELVPEPPPDSAPTTALEVANPHVQHAYSAQAFRCPRCGSTNLADGMVVDFGGDKFEQVRFALKRYSLSWLNSLFNVRPWRRLLRLDAVACRDCGAVTLTVDPAVLRRAEKYRD
jgi:DNA-directed RNA polymerase subunit RPC12/RpoP